MHFQLDEHLLILRDTVRSSFQGMSRAGAEEQWATLARELDLFSLAGPDQSDSESRNLELMLIFEAAGEALLRAPLLDTLVIAPLLAAKFAGAEDLWRAVRSGDARVGFAWKEDAAPDLSEPRATRLHARDNRLFLSGAKKAVSAELPYTHLLVTARADGEDDATTVLVPIADRTLDRDIYQAFDGRLMMDLRFEDFEIERSSVVATGAGGRLSLRRASEYAIAASCAESVGVLRRLVDLTVGHITERKQFGRPLSEFQALQHRLADMLSHLEMASSASLRATLSLSDDALRTQAILSAKITVGRACKYVGENAIQLHGGMGMSEETPVGGYFKRALFLAGLFGSTDQAVRELADAGCLKPAVANG